VDLHLEDKVVLVAGSSRGIGLATARAFLAEGSRTVITGRDGAALSRAQADLESEFGRERLTAYEGDLCDPETITAMLVSVHDRWGTLDCVVANVGSGRGPIGWAPEESDWQRLIETNLSGAYRLIQQVLPAMTKARRGSIVLIASIAGLESTSAPLPYGAAKAALVSYAKNLARQMGPFEVRVNSVAPGNILFPGGSWERHLAERREEVLRQIDADVPLRRFGRPEEIADLIVFLSSDRAAFITGSCVVADGGQTRSM
jgi:3-oxoacyl-[acyl-carrier protein] reductase